MNSLVVFEVAGRHESFKTAAQELHVTAGAVSRQIKKLESHLGVELFARSNRKVSLTEAGRDYWRGFSVIFGQLKSETERLLAGAATKPLHVWCSVTFMRHWLLPRLARFTRAYPDVDLVFSMNRSWQPIESMSDIAIRLSYEPRPGLSSYRLMDAGMTPVCNPAYLEERGTPSSVSDLARHTLLYSMARQADWTHWLGSLADDVLPAARRIRFEGDGLAYAAATEGLGFALGRICFAAPDLARGRLIAPFGPPTATDEAYYVVVQDKQKRQAGVSVFVDWIVAEAAQI